MNCRQTEQRLHELLDSRQDIESDDQLRAHLDDCSECNTLAAAYDTLAHAAPRHEEPSPLPGLANRVLAEVGTTSRAPARVSWRAWSTLAVAASLLVAVGIAVNEQGGVAPTQADDPLTEKLVDKTEPAAKAMNEAVATDMVPPPSVAPAGEVALAREVAGSQMWYRTGKNLATMSLASLRWQRTAASDSEPTSDDQLLDRALNTFRTLWPGESETTTPTRGETGQFEPGSGLLVA